MVCDFGSQDEAIDVPPRAQAQLCTNRGLPFRLTINCGYSGA